MDSLRDHAGRIDEAAATLAAAAIEVARTGPSPRAFGADAPGWPGELGRALHDQWLAAVSARGREAAAMAGRLADTADAVRAAATAYAETDYAARHRQPGEA